MSITLTTMVMIENPVTGQVLVQDRLLKFKGLAFPGGHVDPGESIYNCALREVFEETGLRVRNLQFCGMKHQCGRETPGGDEWRYLVFLYKTRDFSGELVDTEAGRHLWMSVDELRQRKSEHTPRFEESCLALFFGEHSEAFCQYPGRSRIDYDFVYF